MAAERPFRREDPAELVAQVSADKRDLLLRVHRHRLGFEDLEDCYSQATLEMVTRARTRERAFQGEAHVANALEQRFLSRIADRRRALSGRSPIIAATHAALRSGGDRECETGARALDAVSDPTADVAGRVDHQDELRRLREVAAELSEDQRLVLAYQVALGMDCHDFCARFGWSAEKFRKVAQRARARLRVLVADYDSGERCKALADDLAAYVADVAEGDQVERVRRHLSNCQTCTHTARELERVARGVGALLPVPPTLDPDVVHRLGIVGRMLGRLMPFWDTGEGAAAAKAGATGAAAAGGTGAAAAGGGALLGLGTAKLGVVALCAAGAAGGYVVCDQIGLFAGPLPRERHQVVATAGATHRSGARHDRSTAASRAPAPVTHTIRAPASTAGGSGPRASVSSSSRDSNPAGSEFGFEGAGGSTGSESSSSSPPSAQAAAAGAGSAPRRSASAPSSGGSVRAAASEFGFE